MMNANKIAETLRTIAAAEMTKAAAYFDSLAPGTCNVFLMEACRVLDYEHVLQLISTNPVHQRPAPSFDTFVRGWNPLLSLLLPRMIETVGVPISESTEDRRRHVRGVLYTLGCAGLLRHAAEMLEYGMITGSQDGAQIALRMSERASIDHYLDMLEADRLEALTSPKSTASYGPERAREIRDVVKTLVFPFDTGHGVMVGYDADEEVDAFFDDAVLDVADRWQSEGGIHAEARLGGTTGAAVSAVVMLSRSFFQKHIFFVDVAASVIPKINYPMALTIWRSPDEFASSLAAPLQMSASEVRGAVEAASVNRSHGEFFATELRPYVPLFIRISEDHYVSPVSSAFRNPLPGIRALQSFYSEEFSQEVRNHREGWMISDLSHLFLGDRYVRLAKPVKLRQNAKTSTDIDWAVMDRLTGEVGLFQLKWQDFHTSSVRQQRSRGSNFVNQVDGWGNRILAWLEDFGMDQLLRSLHFRTFGRQPSLHLFAIGRSNARFASYGVATTKPELAVSTWPQFVRNRYEIGPAPTVISEIHRRLKDELTATVRRQPLPHDVDLGGTKIRFEDIWSTQDDENQNA